MTGSERFAVIASRQLAPTPIRGPAGHALTYEETERRLTPVLERVPITRVYVGPLHVSVVLPPLSDALYVLVFVDVSSGL